MPFVFGSFVVIPTLVNIAFLASSFSDIYLRCHVARSWSFPFTVAAHVFTKFATNKALTVAYYVANLCFLLASEVIGIRWSFCNDHHASSSLQGFILVASMETIFDNLRQWHGSIANHVVKYYRISCLILTLLLCGLSFSTIIKVLSGLAVCVCVAVCGRCWCVWRLICIRY